MKTYILLSFVLLLSIDRVSASGKISGKVFFDSNKNGIRDTREKGLQNILVSNGIDIIETDKNRYFSLERVGHLPVFVIKPSGYQVSVSKDGQPVFYENNSMINHGELSFGLVDQSETNKVSIALLGDTQPHNVDEVYYILRTCTDDLKTRQYDFALVLGDVVSDNPVLFPLVKDVIAASEHPSYYTFGNHDLNWDSLYVNGLETWDLDWINTVGPTYYAMTWGSTNILSINNIHIKWNDSKSRFDYKYFVPKDQITFVRNYLSHLNKNDLLIISSHAKPDHIINKEEFYALFTDFSNVL